MELGFIIGYCSGIVISLLIDIIFRWLEGDLFEDGEDSRIILAIYIDYDGQLMEYYDFDGNLLEHYHFSYNEFT